MIVVKRRDQRRPLMPRFHRREQGARADARHEDDRVEFAGEQVLGEIERRVIVLERHLAHRRRDHRDAAAPLDHRGDFRCHPAFERDDAQPAEAGRDVRGVGLRFRVHRERIVNLAVCAAARPHLRIELTAFAIHIIFMIL